MPAGHADTAAATAHAPPGQRDSNPLVDMQTMTPSSRLDDPGIGLRDNGRRVLSYAMLNSLFADPDGRDPGRELELHLTGHMEKFAWSFNGIKFSDAEPLRLSYGERLRIVLVNDTMMTHPIHLHGMWSDLEDDDGDSGAQAHHRHAAGQPAQLSRARRRAGPLGVSLPPALPHGSRHDARSQGERGMNAIRLLPFVLLLAGTVAAGADTQPRTAHSPIAHRRRSCGRRVMPASGHEFHDNDIHSYLLLDRLEYRNGDGNGLGWEARGWLGTDLRSAVVAQRRRACRRGV